MSVVPCSLLAWYHHTQTHAKPQQTARDGDIVVAQVEDNGVTLKQFFKEKNRIRLQPANPRYEPMFYDDVRIQGKLVGVIRRVD